MTETMDGDALVVALGALLASIVAAAAAVNSSNSAARSATIAEQQLELVQRKIGMVTDPAKMTEILPIWYMERMANDHWGFGLLLSSGAILAIQQIYGVSDDKQWLEVTMLQQDGGENNIQGHPVLYRMKADRDRTSVRVDQVQAAFELMSN